jgi:hypothetical protein
MSHFLRLTMIVPAAQQSNAAVEAKLNFLDDPRGTNLGTFSAPLSSDGNPPATHFVSCWGGLEPTDFARIRSAIGGIPGATVAVTPNDLRTPSAAERMPDELIASLGLQPVVEDIL